MARPTSVTAEVLQKLEEAFLMGCTDAEACLYADISPGTLYNYQNSNPEFLERKDLLKQNPVFKARRTVTREIETDADLALRFLERKKKDEFSTASQLRHADADGNKLTVEVVRFSDIHKNDVK